MAERKQAKPAADAAAAPAEGAAKRRKLLLIGGGAALAVLLLGVLAWVFLGGDGGEPAAEAGEKAVEVPVALYAALGEKFKIALQSGGKPHHVQTEISVLAREQAVIDDVALHAPLIRARIVSLIGAQDFERLRTDEGRVELRAAVLATIQEVLTAETGKPGVEQVFFTEFVLQ